MQNPPVDLPDSIEDLKAIIARQADEFTVARQELSSARSELSAAKSGLQVKTLEIEKLKLTIARLRKMAFGKSSEKIHREIAQLELSLEELESECQVPQKLTFDFLQNQLLSIFNCQISCHRLSQKMTKTCRIDRKADISIAQLQNSSRR